VKSRHTAAKGGDKMELHDLNAKIHVDTSELDEAIKKAERLLVLLQEVQKTTIPQSATQA